MLLLRVIPRVVLLLLLLTQQASAQQALPPSLEWQAREWVSQKCGSREECRADFLRFIAELGEIQRKFDLAVGLAAAGQTDRANESYKEGRAAAIAARKEFNRLVEKYREK